MQNQAKFCLCFSKINPKLFFVAPNILLISKVSPSLKTKNNFFDHQYEIMNYNQHHKLQLF